MDIGNSIHKTTLCLDDGGNFFATGAQAVVLSDSDTNNAAGSLSLDQLDTSLGTLTAIKLTLSASADEKFGGQLSPGESVFRVIDFNLFVDGSSTLAISGSASNSFLCPPQEGDKPAPDCQYSFSLQASGNDMFDILTTDSLFLGTGTFDLTFNLRARLGEATASIEYTYDAPSAVPLPAGLPLVLTGLGGFWFLRRKKTT